MDISYTDAQKIDMSPGQILYRYDGEISAVTQIAVGVLQLSVHSMAKISLSPGQYVWLEFPEVEGKDPRGSRRAFTVTSIDAEHDTFEIIVRIGESGYKQHLATLKSGDRVRIHGPFGSTFTLDQLPDGNLVMIAGGVSIAAFILVLSHLNKQGFAFDCHLFYVNHDKESALYLDQLRTIAHGNSHVHIHVKYEHLRWEDFKEVYSSSSAPLTWWISGPQAMVQDTYQLLNDGQIPIQSMRFENYYPELDGNLSLNRVQAQVQDHSLLSQAIQNSTNHTVITDANGVILFANTAAEMTTGYTQSEIIGNTPRLWGGVMSPQFYKDFWKHKKSGNGFIGEIVNRRKNGELYYSRAHISPIFGDTNQIVGYIGTEEDITNIKQQEQKIRDSEQRLKFAIEGSRDGLWDWNILTGEVYFSPRFIEMLGYKEKEFPQRIDLWKKLIPTDELEMIEAEYAAFLAGKMPFYQTKHRVLSADGTFRWVLDRGMVTLRSAEGKPVRAVGTYTDITEIIEREKELELMNRVMVGRELKMVALKKEIARLTHQEETQKE